MIKKIFSYLIPVKIHETKSVLSKSTGQTHHKITQQILPHRHRFE